MKCTKVNKLELHPSIYLSFPLKMPVLWRGVKKAAYCSELTRECCSPKKSSLMWWPNQLWLWKDGCRLGFCFEWCLTNLHWRAAAVLATPGAAGAWLSCSAPGRTSCTVEAFLVHGCKRQDSTVQGWMRHFGRSYPSIVILALSRGVGWAMLKVLANVTGLFLILQVKVFL